ncbi:dirigent protein 22-like [Primulina huaijiensis]|uniref:dirigent protein 22-like n=1 Tax=Primulina huaijiensis TaxID=1492673 RepID=UPI003CC7840B
MGKFRLQTIFKICSLLLLTYNSYVYGKTETPKATESVEKWFKKLKKSTEPKFKIIEFYVQDIVSGEGQTVFPVAKSNISFTSPTNFGIVVVADDRFTVGADPKSPTLGRGQGIAALSDLADRVLYLNVVFYFTEGKYKGSSVVILGRDPMLVNSRELSIAGGSGVFRSARGVTEITNCTPYSPTGYTCFKYTLYFTHF